MESQQPVPYHASSSTIESWISQLADQLASASLGEFIFVGIVRGGDTLARRLSRAVEQRSGYCPIVYHIDITLYRDDLYTGLEHLSLGGSNLPLTVDSQKIVLVDDVLFTGRTIRAAIQEIMDYGRPEWVKLLVLVDRGCRELPIQPDFTGEVLECPKTAKVLVSLSDSGEGDRVDVQDGAYTK